MVDVLNDGQSQNLGRLDQLLALGPLHEYEQELLAIEWLLRTLHDSRHSTCIYPLI